MTPLTNTADADIPELAGHQRRLLIAGGLGAVASLAGLFFDVITNGFGAMPDYASQITPEDRWAIVAYVRALQLSEHASLTDIPPSERDKIR